MIHGPCPDRGFYVTIRPVFFFIGTGTLEYGVPTLPPFPQLYLLRGRLCINFVLCNGPSLFLALLFIPSYLTFPKK